MCPSTNGSVPRIVGVFLLLISFGNALFAREDSIKPVDATMAAELFKTETAVRNVPTDVKQRLTQLIDDATAAAVAVHRTPSKKEEALAVFEAIQMVMVKSNFLQPPEEKDWPDTIGIALTPRPFSEQVLQAVLAHPDNAKRRPYLDLTKPMFFVDCDMGAQIFMAIGERLGWDIKLVELPKHNFVRWHLPNGDMVNWDWTHGQSLPDTYYDSFTWDDVRLRHLYLRSLEHKEARSYYIALIASKADKAKSADAEILFQKAMVDLSHHPLVLNNFAWFYATRPAYKHKSKLAVAYSLAAWSLRPNDGNYADTVACSFALAGNDVLAKQIENFAIDHANSPGQRKGFEENLKRIEDGKPCE